MNKATSVSLLETCSTFNSLKHLHAHMITLGLLRYTYITSRILSFYTIHDHINCARKIFDKLGEIAGRNVIELEPQHCGRYVGLANVYAATGSWEGVGKVRSVMRERRVVTTPGWSSIEHHGTSQTVWTRVLKVMREVTFCLDPSKLPPLLNRSHIEPLNRPPSQIKVWNLL